MMHDALSVTIRSSTELSPLNSQAYAQYATLLRLLGYGSQSLLSTELKIRTTTYTDESQTVDPSSPLLTIKGKVAKTRHSTPTHITYYIEEH